jgi:tRNA(fMet)-specific endonuclease VapC
MTLAELRYGADLRRSRKLHRLIDTFADTIAPVPFDRVAADRFGPVAAALTRDGTPIDPFDTAIAAHALSLDLILVTNNVKLFGEVSGLRVENWC